MVGAVFIDTCTFENFASVNRLDLLEGRYGHRAKWTETIEDEVKRGLARTPGLRDVLAAPWLGKPIDSPDSIKAVSEIDLIRRGLLKGFPPESATRHLGEAEIIYFIEKGYPGAIFITDDIPALDFARHRGLTAIDTVDVLGECFQMDEIGCPAAYQLIEAMVDKNRGVRLPASHMEVCPKPR